MKTTAFKLTGFFLMGILVWSCSKTDTGSTPTAFKEAITVSSQNLNNAMTDIATSQAFQLLSVSSSSGDMMKSGTVYSANIPLDLVKGVYDYKALKTSESKYSPLIRFFTKSADPARMVVNMPLAKMKNPHVLREYLKSDSTLTNNFSISVSDYHNNYNSYRDYDYVNVAAITIDNAAAGSLNIKSVVSPTLGTKYASQFAFSNDYTAKYQYSSGDTIVSGFSILKAASVLYEEKLLTIKNDTARFGREHQYILTIGNVKMVRKSASAVEVYVNGVLQPKAVVKVIDNEEKEDTEHSICKKRDLQITFEDGTTSTVSDLVGKSIADITTLFTSLHQVYFAAYVVDWIGYDIYYKR